MAVYAEMNLDTGESFLDPQAPANMNLAPSDAEILKAAAASGIGPVPAIERWQSDPSLGPMTFGPVSSVNLGAGEGSGHDAHAVNWTYVAIAAVGVGGLLILARGR